MTEMERSGPGVEVIRQRWLHLRERLDASGAAQVRVLAVTKGFSPQLLRDAYRAGIRRCGENYAQEVVSKAEVIREITASDSPERCELHFIGQLQTNKVRMLRGLVDRFDSVDRAGLVTELARRIPGARVLIQVNTTGDAHKGGCVPDEVPDLVALARHHGLQVEGLMTVGPTGAGPEMARPGFALVRSLADGLGLAECSMGMSDDFEVAISEGSTEIRVGTALFGSRS